MANNLNIPKPPPGQPALLTFDDVTAMFHEFGHALHGMLSNVRLPAALGDRSAARLRRVSLAVQRDVGARAGGPRALRAALPDRRADAPELLDKVLAAQKFDQGYATTEYLEAAMLDQAWHQITAAQAPRSTR